MRLYDKPGSGGLGVRLCKTWDWWSGNEAVLNVGLVVWE